MFLEKTVQNSYEKYDIYFQVRENLDCYSRKQFTFHDFTFVKML